MVSPSIYKNRFNTACTSIQTQILLPSTSLYTQGKIQYKRTPLVFFLEFGEQTERKEEKSPSTMSDNVTTSLGLMRRMPPNKVEQSLNGLMNLLPDDQDELLQRIDQPLEEASDPVNVSVPDHERNYRLILSLDLTNAITLLFYYSH